MKIVLVLLLHFIIWTQNVEAKEIAPLKYYLGHQHQLNAIHSIQSKELANMDENRLISINDLWNKIKNSFTNAWHAIKDIVAKTKERISVWIQDIKKRGKEVLKEFEKKLEVLKEKLNVFIEALKDTAGDVKQCVQKEKDAIETLLKQIAIRVTSCIAGGVNSASVLDSYQSRLELNDTEFVKRAEDKINGCVHDDQNADECLNKARGEIYDDMEHTEIEIMDTRLTSRNLVQDALETILQCAADGIIDASGAITEEVIKIVDCVKGEKENPDTKKTLYNI